MLESEYLQWIRTQRRKERIRYYMLMPVSFVVIGLCGGVVLVGPSWILRVINAALFALNLGLVLKNRQLHRGLSALFDQAERLERGRLEQVSFLARGPWS